MNVQEHLAHRNVRFETLHHAAARNPADVAEKVEAPLHAVAKNVLLKADGGYCYVMAVAPAHRDVDLEKAGEALGGSTLVPASAEEAAAQCPDTEGRILSPFGSQYNLKVLLDEELANQEHIHFPGATREETIRIRVEDYIQAENPLVVSLTSEGS
jgi:Ala-tRNA(Pro) deacylase